MTLADEPPVTSRASAGPRPQPPLVIDLDGTLFVGDTLGEGLLWLLFNKPLTLLALAPKFLSGRAALKRAVADAAPFDHQHAVYRKDVIALARRAREDGDAVHLVTGADQSLADSVAAQLGLFDDSTGSDGVTNLVGTAKADFLKSRHPDGFHYVGNSVKDRPVWAAAAGATVIAQSEQAARRIVGAAAPAFELIPARPATLKDWVKALRLHHWVKNFLLFVPLALGQLFDDVNAIAYAIAAFFIFGMIASSGYLVNDLSDIAADRTHPRKRKRAIAAGRISTGLAAGLAAALGAGGLAWAALLDADFAVWALVYYVCTLAYTLRLKRMPLTDILVIGGLFTIRLTAGMAILDQTISIWLTSFSFALFSSLAFAKRNGELSAAAARGDAAPRGRGYRLDDRHLLTAFGVGAAMTAMVVMLLYFQFRALSTGLYDDVEFLYFAPLVLFSWLMRVWIRAYRGELHDDPIIFALKDRTSWLHAVAVVAIWLIADKPGFPK